MSSKGAKMQDIVKELCDLRYLNWSKTRKSSGTAGSFLKSYDDSGKKKLYYKLSDFDPVKGIIGHECVNEIVVQRILRYFGFDHLEYRLLYAAVNVEGKDHTTYLCESEDFKKPGEMKIALEDYYLMNKEGSEGPLNFCKRMGWEEYIYRMFLVDYLVLNRDRHGANIEVLSDPKKKEIRLSPLFDHGLSLVCRCHTSEELRAFNVLEDKKVQSFVGTPSTLANIKLIPEDFWKEIYKLKEEDLDSVFDGLDEAIGEEYIAKMREMIWERWCYLDRI